MQRMRIFRALVIGAAFFNMSCSVNILETFANKNSNEALYESARIKTNNKDWSGALTDISKMTGTYPSLAKVVDLEASAYAGRCGLIFTTFVTEMQNLGTSRLFPFLLANFMGATSGAIDDCISAQALMQSLGTPSVRSTNDNMFIALVEFAKIGTILNYYGDVGQTGSVTAAYNPCTNGGGTRPAAGGSITDSDAAEIGAALAIIIENLTALAGTVNLGSGSLTSINNVCSALGVLGASYNFCTNTDASTYTANQILAVRSLVLEGKVLGLQAGACPVNGDVTNPACRCF